TAWFGTTWLSGLLIVLIPYLICSILTITVGAVSKGMTAALVGRCAEAVLGGMLAFFVLYNACAFALMLTGRTVTALLASLAVIVYPFLALTLVSALENVFYNTFYSDGLHLSDKLAGYLSPVGLFSALISQSSAGTLSFAVLAASVLMSALL